MFICHLRGRGKTNPIGPCSQVIADESFITTFISKRDHCSPLHLADCFMIIFISALGCEDYI